MDPISVHHQHCVRSSWGFVRELGTRNVLRRTCTLDFPFEIRKLYSNLILSTIADVKKARFPSQSIHDLIKCKPRSGIRTEWSTFIFFNQRVKPIFVKPTKYVYVHGTPPCAVRYFQCRSLFVRPGNTKQTQGLFLPLSYCPLALACFHAAIWPTHSLCSWRGRRRRKKSFAPFSRLYHHFASCIARTRV